MQWIWVLVGMPLAGLLCFVYVISRGNALGAPNYVGQVAKAVLPSIWEGGLSLRGNRKISWISAREFEALVQRSEDVILIDLGSKSTGRPSEFKCSHVLFIESGGMIDVLRWSPPSSRIVIYGPRDKCAAAIPTVSKVSGAAPVYLLVEGLGSAQTRCV
jgi:hypothetical protein